MEDLIISFLLYPCVALQMYISTNKEDCSKEDRSNEVSQGQEEENVNKGFSYSLDLVPVVRSYRSKEHNIIYDI